MTAPTAVPTTTAAWEEYLNTICATGEAFKAAFEDKGENGFEAKLKGYVTAQNKERTDIATQVQEFTQATLAEMFTNGGLGAKQATTNANRLNLALEGQRGHYGRGLRMALANGANVKAPGRQLDGKFANMGEFIQTIWHHRLSGKYRINGADARDLDARLALVNEYSTAVPDAGGFLVPEEYRAQLLMLGLEGSIVVPRATVIPMSTQTLVFPTVDATSNVSSVFGGIVVYRTQAGQAFVESQAKFGKVELTATKQTALAYIHNETVRDSAPAIDSIIGQMLPQAIAYNADIDYLTATGAGEPLGALHADNPSLVVVPKETGQGAATIVWQNVLKMYARLLPQSIGNSVWLASPDTFVELATMALNVGTGGSAVWITDGTGAPVLTLLGRPVIMTEKTPGVLGAQGDLSLVDFSFYLVGIRDNLMIDTSDHVRFTSDQTTIRAIARNDGRPWLASAITPHNNGPTLSPFVTLAVRS